MVVLRAHWIYYPEHIASQNGLIEEGELEATLNIKPMVGTAISMAIFPSSMNHCIRISPHITTGSELALAKYVTQCANEQERIDDSNDCYNYVEVPIPAHKTFDACAEDI